MEPSPQVKYYANLAMVMISVMALSNSWTALMDPLYAKIINDCIMGAYMVLGFVVSGVKPPAPIK